MLALARKYVALTRSLAWLGPLLVRLTIGVSFFYAGKGKLENIDDFIKRFDNWGIPMPVFNTWLASLTECIGGAMLILGLGTRFIAVPLAFTMVVAIWKVVGVDFGYDVVDGVRTFLGPWEWLKALLSCNESLNIAVFLWLAFAGAGPVSLDAIVAPKIDGKS